MTRQQTMSSSTSPQFTINGTNYDGKLLAPEGQQLLALLNEAQNELTRLETQKALLKSAQQQLITQLKPFLPAPTSNKTQNTAKILGMASDEIPTTPVRQPESEPAELPNNIQNHQRKVTDNSHSTKLGACCWTARQNPIS